jgi:hypothetical protein
MGIATTSPIGREIEGWQEERFKGRGKRGWRKYLMKSHRKCLFLYWLRLFFENLNGFRAVISS